jgi:hypothetical protein
MASWQAWHCKGPKSRRTTLTDFITKECSTGGWRFTNEEYGDILGPKDVLEGFSVHGGLLRALIGAFPTFDASCAPAQSTMLMPHKAPLR